MEMYVMSGEKDLDYYLNHMDEMGDLTDDEIDALTVSAPDEFEDDPAPDQSDVVDAEAEKGDTDGAATPGDTSNKAADTDSDRVPDGVLSKDGKHVIPFWRMAEVQDKAEKLAQQLADLQAQVAAGTPPTVAQQQEQVADMATLLSDEEIEQISEDYPEGIGQFMKSANAQIKQLSGKLAAFDKEREDKDRQAMEDAEKAMDDEVNSAISATPKIAHLIDHDPDGYDRAVELDVMLRQKPEWAGKSYTERFAKVVEVYETLYGDIPASQQTQKTTTVETPSPVKKVDVQKSAVPVSMSAIPGGSSPPVDELAAVSEKSGAELTEKFMNMTPDQIDAMMNRLL